MCSDIYGCLFVLFVCLIVCVCVVLCTFSIDNFARFPTLFMNELHSFFACRVLFACVCLEALVMARLKSTMLAMRCAQMNTTVGSLVRSLRNAVQCVYVCFVL
jgi:ABC-type antimicrobial peptide transport system permease subunit